MDVLSLGAGNETTRFHHTSWRCRNCVAACGERATARADSTYRRPDGVCERQSGSAGTDRGVIKATAQQSQHRWKVTDADREAIVADLIHTGRRHKGIPILRP